ncbi:MAG: glucuronate isomerase [Clostridia bacterium]|nr:glucuronate isomerase [Clostridia bacterium]
MAEFRDRNVDLLLSKYSKRIYAQVKDLPIIDYHCHLSPKEIYEDEPFDNIGVMWLAGDHYKWRLMRGAGIDEKYITGDADWWEKFYQFAKVAGTAYGNPIKDWCALELSFFFDIDTPLNEATAQDIWNRANKVIASRKLSPRKLIKLANVEYIATTDDPCDDLKYHDLLAKDSKLKVKIVPSFRVDNIVLARAKGYGEYIERLGEASGVNICDLTSLKEAIIKRMDYFAARGCKFSDVGVEGFPKRVAEESEAYRTFKKLIAGLQVDDFEFDGFWGYMYLFLAKAYKERDMVQQWHLAVTRNSNTLMFNKLGRDMGFDCVGDAFDVKYVKNIIDMANSMDALPKTIIYTLNPTMYYPLITMCGAFRDVVIGISWWFCDHKRGMYETLRTLTELGHITSLVGMLTDSRSFLSYTRHDYYRQIVCDFLGSLMESEEDIYAIEVAKALCYGNAKKLVEGKNEF